jgi:hypothetical protein
MIVGHHRRRSSLNQSSKQENHMNMKRGLQAVLIATALSMGALASIGAAHAANVSVQFDAGNVAFGLTDGYWDRDRAWHSWPNSAARNDWRTHNRTHYIARRHDRAPGWGWSDSNRYWEHH